MKFVDVIYGLSLFQTDAAPPAQPHRPGGVGQELLAHPAGNLGGLSLYRPECNLLIS